MEKKKNVWKVGKNYLLRTATMIYTGKLVKVTDKELVLTSCCWIPETARWMQSIVNVQFNEIEPYPLKSEVLIGRGALLDAVIIGVLPTTQK